MSCFSLSGSRCLTALQRLPFLLDVQFRPDLAALVGHAVVDQLLLARLQVEEVLDVVLVHPLDAAGHRGADRRRPRARCAFQSLRLAVRAPEHHVGVEPPLQLDLGHDRLARDDLLLVEERLVVVDQVVVQDELVVEPPLVLPGDDVADLLVLQPAVDGDVLVRPTFTSTRSPMGTYLVSVPPT